MTVNSVLQEYVSRETKLTLQSAASDWITLTGTLEMDFDGIQAFDIWDRLNCHKVLWSGNGYKGFYCSETKLRYGTRLSDGGRTEELLVSSGPSSCDVVGILLENNHRLRATRFDVQSTGRLNCKDAEIAVRAYDMLSLLADRGIKPAGRRQFNLVRSNSGDTLYVGARGSKTKFFRLYDKGGEKGEETGLLWRQEVQFNRKFAASALRSYETIMYDVESVSNMVSKQFAADCGFSLIPVWDGAVDVSITREPLAETNYEKRLRWLARCVRPVVAELLEIGLEDEARSVLGLGREM